MIIKPIIKIIHYLKKIANAEWNVPYNCIIGIRSKKYQTD